MTSFEYTNWTNLDSHFVRPYQPGDRLVRGHTGTIEGELPSEYLCEAIWLRHNADDRPDGQLCPSQSNRRRGDVPGGGAGLQRGLTGVRGRGRQPGRLHHRPHLVGNDWRGRAMSKKWKVGIRRRRCEACHARPAVGRFKGGLSELHYRLCATCRDALKVPLDLGVEKEA